MIGTELLLGDVLDTNSQYLARELAYLGIDCLHRVTVGDNPQRIRECMSQALSRADILLTSGGLGPTADDLTTECVADLMGVPQITDREILAHIRELFAKRNFKMPVSNEKQALRPEGALTLPNPVGSAPGIIFVLSPEQYNPRGITGDGTKVIMTFPGVPSELKAMWAQTARAYLQEHYGGSSIWSCELKHFGIGESALAEKYAHLLDLQNPTVAPYAGRWECRLRVAAKAADQDAARLLAQPVIDEIKAGSGHTLYGYDDDTLESTVGRLLTERNMTLAVAESCTGGLVSERLTDIAGSSRYVKLNAVTYANEAKMKVLGVSAQTLETHGAVSAECAAEMARGMLDLADADVALSITGIAGPGGGTTQKPVGHVYLGLASRAADGSVVLAGKQLSLGDRLPRAEIRWRTANEALNMVRLHLLGAL